MRRQSTRYLPLLWRMEESARSRWEWNSYRPAPVDGVQGYTRGKCISCQGPEKITMSPPSCTWMSSSLELNSDTSTFSPSDTLVSETHSRPEARTCASEASSRFRPDFITLTKLKDGWRGPRFLFLASFATSITSSQHLAEIRRKRKKVRLNFEQWRNLWPINYDQQKNTPTSVNLQLDQYSLKVLGVSDQQWPLQTLFRAHADVTAAFQWSDSIGWSAVSQLTCQPCWLLIGGRESERICLYVVM